jgi:DNA helicase II / ATP-dependent DNA helicase PcrA
MDTRGKGGWDGGAGGGSGSAGSTSDADDGFAEDAQRDYEDDVSSGAASSKSRGRAATSPPPFGGRDTVGGLGAREGRPTRMSGFAQAARRGGPLTIEGELVAKSTGTVSAFAVGDRVFHQKFGNGNVVVVDGNKLTIAFDRAGEKRVVDSFVERV